MHEDLVPCNEDPQDIALCQDSKTEIYFPIMEHVLGKELSNAVIQDLREDEEPSSKKLLKICFLCLMTIVIVGGVFYQYKEHFFEGSLKHTPWEWLGEKPSCSPEELQMIKCFNQKEYPEVERLYRAHFSPYAQYVYLSMLCEQKPVQFDKIKQIIQANKQTSEHVNSLQNINWSMLYCIAFMNQNGSPQVIFERNKNRSVLKKTPAIHAQLIDVIKIMQSILTQLKADKYEHQRDFIRLLLGEAYISLWLIEGHTSGSDYADNKDSKGVDSREIALEILKPLVFTHNPNVKAVRLLQFMVRIVHDNWGMFDGVYFDGKTYYNKGVYEENKIIQKLKMYE